MSFARRSITNNFLFTSTLLEVSQVLFSITQIFSAAKFQSSTASYVPQNSSVGVSHQNRILLSCAFLVGVGHLSCISVERVFLLQRFTFCLLWIPLYAQRDGHSTGSGSSQTTSQSGLWVSLELCEHLISFGLTFFFVVLQSVLHHKTLNSSRSSEATVTTMLPKIKVKCRHLYVPLTRSRGTGS